MATRFDPSDIADLPPLDVAAWKKVLTGLTWMRVAMIAMLFAFPLGFAVFVVATSLLFAAWWLAIGLLIVVGLCYLTFTMIFNVGLWNCCSAPIESGVRPFAHASLVLALVGTVLPFAWVILKVLNRLSHARFGWLSATFQDERIQSFLLAGLALNWLLTIACWFWCLGGIAAFFVQQRLANTNRAVAWLVLIFGSTFMLSPFTEHLGWVLYSLAPFYFGAFIIVPLSFIWGFGLLVETRYMLLRVIEPLTDP